MSHSKTVRDYSKYILKLFFKITNGTECHYDFQYINGLNKLKGKFNDDEESSCVFRKTVFH